MREFVLPFKPEELLAQPADGRLWAADLPPVDDWSVDEAGAALDALIGRLLSSSGRDVAEDESFSLLFALLQGWPRLDDATRPRVVDLLVDAARRLIAEVARLQKTSSKQKDQGKAAAHAVRNAAKVAVFFLRWAAERVMKQAPDSALLARGRGKGGRRGAANAEQEASAEEAKEAQKALEKQRCSVLTELQGLICRGSMPWLWITDPAAWQQVAQSVSDAGFLVLDSEQALKHRETRQLSLRCIAEPLLQEGHQHSNLLVATVSKLAHGLRKGDGGAPFAADVLLLAHATPLPRLFLVELTNHCNAAELSAQGAFQRSLAAFLVAVSERLPHLVLGNISVLLPLLDVDCYPLRSAIVESIGQLLSAEGRKLPKGAHCDAGRAPEAAEGGDEAPAEPEAGDDGPAMADEEGGKEDKAALPDTYFSMATATKKDLLETLLTRSLDKSVWVRYRVLQTLTALASNTRVVALPREQWARVLEIATRRMQDSASTTRKAAMGLLRALIEFHPYGPALQGSGDEREKAKVLLAEVDARLRRLSADEAAEAEEVLAANSEDAQKRVRIQKKTVTEQTVDKDIEKALAEDADVDGDRAEKRERQREALKRMRDCYTQRLRFVELIDAAEARLRALLVSRTNTDVTEAIGVVVELRLRGVPAAAKAFDQVLGLVWSRHPAIKDAAVDAFQRMHLEGRDAPGTVSSLLSMYQHGCAGGTWTYTHLASVQELIQQAAEKDYIDAKALIPELVKALEGPFCSMAIRTLTALGAANADKLAVVMPRIAELMGPGGAAVGKNIVERLERSRLLCQLLNRLFAAAGAQMTDATWGHVWTLCQHAVCVVVESFATSEVPPQWFGAAQAAMDLSFELSMSPKATTAVQRCPDKVWEQILTRMLCGALGHAKVGMPGPSPKAPICDHGASGEEEEGRDTEIVEVPVTFDKVGSAQIACIVFIAGHLALRMLVYLESLQSALKRKRLADEDARMAEQRENNKKKAKKVKGKGGKEEEADDGGAEAASMGMAGQEEREAEAFAEVAEHGLLYGPRSLLDRVKPLLHACLLDPAMRSDPILRRLGAIGLCKFMTVSKRFCQEHLQLLFSILFPKVQDTALLSCAESDAESVARDGLAGVSALLEDLTLRQSLLVAVGDLLFRHPNVVEPWTGRLYATLGGNSGGTAATELRLTALLVLTHLVLNDMMKPRAVLLVRALWLTACVHEPTARVARILFQELSKRSTNVVYNLLPEIIARLPEHEDTSGQVQGGAEERVQYMMQFVEKEKHVEGLIEKLSIRLEQAANISGGAAATVAMSPGEEAEQGEGAGGPPTRVLETVSCLSHALGSMNYTDRCILRLHDAVVVRKALHTALSYHSVARECLLAAVEKARKPKAGGKEKGGAAEPAPEGEPPAPAADGAAAGGGRGGGVGAAAAAALDAIEQTVVGLAKGQKDGADEQVAPAEEPAAPAQAPASSRGGGGRGGGRGRGSKRKAEEEAAQPEAAAEPGFEEPALPEKAPAKKGRGRGGGGAAAGRGRGAAAAAAAPAAGEQEDAPLRSLRGRGAGRGAKKPRQARAADDDEAEVDGAGGE